MKDEKFYGLILFWALIAYVLFYFGIFSLLGKVLGLFTYVFGHSLLGLFFFVVIFLVVIGLIRKEYF